jgi:uncharacterized protein involved in outer membrane biogenesis
MIRRRPLWIVLGAAAVVLLLAFGAMGWIESEAGRQWVERRASDATGREFSIGEIDVKLGWQPGIRVSGLRIANPDWAKTRHLADTEYIDARFRLLSLLIARPVVEELTLVQAKIGAEREENRNTWTFREKEEETQEDKPFPAFVRRVNIDRGYVYYRDTTLDTALEIDVTGGVGDGEAIELTAKGKAKGQDARAVARLPGLLPTPDTPVEMSAALTIGDITAAFAGIVRADDVDGVDIDIDISGASLADLKRLAPVNLPETPPYRLLGRFRNPADAFIIDGLQGRVGDSDLSGNVRYTRSKRPVLQARLTSKLLDLDDLGPTVGAPSKTASSGETAGAKQEQEVRKTKETGRVLPDKGFKVEDWPIMDADVLFEGKRIVDAAQVPIENLSVKWTLKDGVLRFEPLTFAIADGKVNATVSLDGTRKPVAGKANITMSGVNLRKLAPATSKVTEPLGTLYARIDVTGNGTSVAELLGSANGRLAMFINGGLISNLLVELGGLDVAESLRILATRDVQVKLRCAVADLSLKDGIATPQVLIIDTTDTIVDGKGTLSFKSEEFDLVTSPEPKDPSPFVLRSPITIRGSFKDPVVRPKIGPIAARTAAALLLGAANPLLATLPFIEFGPGEDSDCGKLMQQVKKETPKGAGAPPAAKGK